MFLRTLPDNAQAALAILGKSGVMDMAYMAGGTAMALRLGHRQSIDFDFFTPNEFDEDEIRGKLTGLGKYIADEQKPKTMLGFFEGVKFSLFFYRYPLIRPADDCGGIKLASLEDISAMKMAATLTRATKKDYIDIYFLLKQFGIKDMLKFYDEKYANLDSNKLALIKGLQYFEDVDISELPVMLEEVNWEEVKEYLKGEAKRYWQNFDLGHT